MLELLLSAMISSKDPEWVNKYCSRIAGVTYASDNLTDQEWGRFKKCKVSIVNAFREREAGFNISDTREGKF